MKIQNVLIVYKKSAYEVYGNDRRYDRFLRMLRKQNATTRRFLSSHKAHNAALVRIEKTLTRKGIKWKTHYRAFAFVDRKYDLIISVGGDGTFLDASHHVIHRPLLGVNSNPRHSVGNFCGATVGNFSDVLDRIERGTCGEIQMTRLEVRIGRKIITTPVLNDVLLTHGNPAATTRYLLRVRGREEEQKSSGIWVSPPAGTTGAIRGAGGAFLPITSRQYQYRVRELYYTPNGEFRLNGGKLRPREKVIAISRMRAGKIYIDGSHIVFPFPLGERAEVSTRAPKLRVFAFDERRRRKQCR